MCFSMEAEPLASLDPSVLSGYRSIAAFGVPVLVDPSVVALLDVSAHRPRGRALTSADATV